MYSQLLPVLCLCRWQVSEWTSSQHCGRHSNGLKTRSLLANAVAIDNKEINLKEILTTKITYYVSRYYKYYNAVVS